mgnify:CR=1 FL=1|tara:strand:+ start:4627 stop:5226 length:600 start_codon:yes stop_codon:yes gene_type:complete
MLLIIDDFFNNEIRKNIQEHFFPTERMNTNIWGWGHSSNNKSYEYAWLYTELVDKDYFNIYLNKIIRDKLILCLNTIFKSPIKVLDMKLDRLYGNGMYHGSESCFHTDCHDENAYTFLYFLSDCCNEENADEVGGYFYYKDNNEIKCVEPICNRAIFFNGNILHKGEPFNKSVNKLRVSIVWKFNDDKNHIKSLYETNK